MLIKTAGIVLKNSKFNENDSLLVIFTRKLGKVSAVAKGARNPKSVLLSGVQPFCYSDFVLYKGKSLYTVSQCDVKQSFYKLREDLDRLTYAAYLLELVSAETREGQTNNRLFNLLGKTLLIMSNPEAELNTVLRAFEIKFLHYSGYTPQLNDCVNCGSTQQTGWKFSPKEGGLLCSNCHSIDYKAIKMSDYTLKLAKYLLVKDISEIQKLKISNFLNLELSKVLKEYIFVHINKQSFKSLDIIEKI
ncbi:DNA repair protein RecO [Serpentinicella alkaliphila]|uniref:DNA repair protein RecO n=1 Tax=Serpentinicella alkaliphila TaxID=1734049 RepID=A0A4R2TVV1_9FIRM|nr:DNA repair protein RecO [Serpentinicella alkaliphila]QUH26895.1 DNA repair protein RecO [Serpentinicella alkaliphila]TCQ08128.1 DNA replication and repair protein RecO [Serpentinicella alkaliphila]